MQILHGNKIPKEQRTQCNESERRLPNIRLLKIRLPEILFHVPNAESRYARQPRVGTA